MLLPPGAANQAVPHFDRLSAQELVYDAGSRGSLLENFGRHFGQREASFRNVSRQEFGPAPLNQVKRAAARVENAGRAFHDQAVEISGANRFRKSRAQTVQEIEDEGFLDLDLLLRELEQADAPRQHQRGRDPPDDGRNEEPEKKGRPHEGARLLLGGLWVQVLFQVFEDVLKPGEILRRGLAQRLVRVQHLLRLLLLLHGGRGGRRAG